MTKDKHVAAWRGILILLGLAWLIVLAWGSAAYGTEARFNGFCRLGTVEDVFGADQLHQNKVVLITSQSTVQPGEVIQARLLNSTAKTVSYGSEFQIQRHGLEGWITDPSSPDRYWPRSARRLPPERMGRCYRHIVQAEQPPGRYRFVTWIQETSRKKVKVAEFRIRR